VSTSTNATPQALDTQRRDATAVALAALALGLAARLLIVVQPIEILTSRFLADDYFYYLNVAYHVAQGHGSTFDGGISTTNGYQPMFLALLVVAFWLGIGKLTAIHVGLAIQAVASAAGAWLSFRLLKDAGHSWGGALVCALLSLNPFFVAASVNGFETSLAVTLGLWTLVLWQRGSPPMRVGLAVGLACLARLDSVLLVLALVAEAARSRSLRDALKIGAIAGLMVAPWALWSTVRFGTPLPDSGLVKLHWSDPEGVSRSLRLTAQTLPRVVLPPFSDSLVATEPPPAVWILASVFALAAAWRMTRLRIAAAWSGLVLAVYLLLAGSGGQVAFIRYLAPVWIVSLVLLATWPLTNRAALVIPFVLWHAQDLRLYMQWALSHPPPPSFLEVARTKGTPLVDTKLADGDSVAAFDSGILGYFSRRPVVNLDGLMNHDVAVLQKTCSGSYADCIRRYMDQIGVTVLAGWTASYWADLLPEWTSWERLYESPPLEGGFRFVILRRPAPAPGPYRSARGASALALTAGPVEARRCLCVL
jgi:hypothetical protein